MKPCLRVYLNKSAIIIRVKKRRSYLRNAAFIAQDKIGTDLIFICRIFILGYTTILQYTSRPNFQDIHFTEHSWHV
jgi:hypothetical protein